MSKIGKSTITSTFLEQSEKGEVTEAQLKEVLKTALAGKGISRDEAIELHHLGLKHGDLFTPGASDTFDAFLATMIESWSHAEDVFLPELDLEELLKPHSVAGYYANRGGGGSKLEFKATSRGGGGSKPKVEATPGSTDVDPRTALGLPKLTTRQQEAYDKVWADRPAEGTRARKMWDTLQ